VVRLAYANVSGRRSVSRLAGSVVVAWVVGCAAVSAGTEVPAPQSESVPAVPVPFDQWLEGVRAEALARGIRQETVQQAFEGLQPQLIVVERDRTQAEFALTLDAYLARRLSKTLVRDTRGALARHEALFRKVAATYGVPADVLAAVWSIESNLGRFSGVRPTIQAVATLAWDGRRAAFFRRELLDALTIIDRGDIEPERLKGSWAGALGQPQFMPSTYLRYAQDFDGDGRRDIWDSEPDVFASVAYYMERHGWTAGEAWGREIRIPAAGRKRALAIPRREAGCRAERLMTQPQPLNEWRRMGFRTMSGTALPVSTAPASLLQAGARSFLLYSNYDALLAYNCAHTYALSVGLLADRLH
jgi:membrane-bound lytic murein transglycosylase B